MYELMKKSFQLCQGDRSLSKYYKKLKSIFIRLDYHKPKNIASAIDNEKNKEVYYWGSYLYVPCRFRVEFRSS